MKNPEPEIFQLAAVSSDGNQPVAAARARELYVEMEMAAGALIAFDAWTVEAGKVIHWLRLMQDGGETAIEALKSLLSAANQADAQPRATLQRQLLEYHQLIGRWYLAEQQDNLSRSPFPR